MWALCVDWPAARSASVRCSPPGRNLVQARTNRRAEKRQGLGATTSFKQHLRAHRSAAARACSGVRKGEYTSKLHSPDHCTERRGAQPRCAHEHSQLMDLKVAQLVVFVGLFLPCTRQASSTRAPPLAHAPAPSALGASARHGARGVPLHWKRGPRLVLQTLRGGGGGREEGGEDEEAALPDEPGGDAPDGKNRDGARPGGRARGGGAGAAGGARGSHGGWHAADPPRGSPTGSREEVGGGGGGAAAAGPGPGAGAGGAGAGGGEAARRPHSTRSGSPPGRRHTVNPELPRMGHVIGHTAIGTVGSSAAGGMRNRTHNTPLRQTLSFSASSRNSFNRTLNAGNRTKTKGRPRMSRAHSEVTCLFIISYAYSERTDLGFYMFHPHTDTYIFMCMYMLCGCVGVWVCVGVGVGVGVGLCVCLFVYVCNTYVCNTNICMFVCDKRNTHTHTHARAHTHTHTHTHSHTHTHRSRFPLWIPTRTQRGQIWASRFF